MWTDLDIMDFLKLNQQEAMSYLQSRDKAGFSYDDNMVLWKKWNDTNYNYRPLIEHCMKEIGLNLQ